MSDTKSEDGKDFELEDDFVEEVPPDTAKTPDVSEEVESYSAGVQKRIDELRAKYGEQERLNKELQANFERAVTVARQLADENANLKKDRQTSEEAVFDGLVGSLTSDLTLAKQELRAAHEAGDAEKIVDATTKVSVLAADLRRAQVAKAGVKLQEKEPVHAEPKPAPPKTNPVVDAKAKAWIARNATWFQRDQEKTRVALAADSYVRAMGIDPASDEYYEEVDKVIDMSMSRRHTDDTRAATARDPAASQPVTAQGRSAPATNGKRKISLTSDEMAVARRLGVSPEDYARSKAAGTAII